MKYIIDLSSFVVEANDEHDAYNFARKLLDSDPARADICEVSEYDPDDHGEPYETYSAS